MVSGTFPPYSSWSIFMHFEMSRALLGPRPQGRTISSISPTGASARAAAVGNFSYSRGVTISTRLSVHWAASLTLTSSCQALS